MNKILITATILTAAIFSLLNCGVKREIEDISDASNENTTFNPKDVVRKSAVSIDSLNNILLRSFINKDKNLYISYCITTEQEESLANLIVDKRKKKYFLREFGFSIHEEVNYFENIIKYIEKSKIDLSKIELSIIEVFDYNRSNYAEIILKEVIIPIIQDSFERDIVYVAIQIDGRWYFTSELNL